MDHKDADSSLLAKLSIAALSAAAVLAFAGAGPVVFVPVVAGLLAARTFARNLGGPS